VNSRVRVTISAHDLVVSAYTLLSMSGQLRLEKVTGAAMRPPSAPARATVVPTGWQGTVTRAMPE
jgi:hypothetical protein